MTNRLGSCLDRIRQTAPCIHCITNYVTVNDVANLLLACGARPIMADDPEEAAEITRLSQGLSLNIGTVQQHTVSAMLAAGREANRLGHPIVLDPVGVGASALRTRVARELTAQLKLSAIRCNISEIKALISGDGDPQGVDAAAGDAIREETLEQTIVWLKRAAARLECVLAVTGAIDLVTDGDRCFVLYGGRAEMGRVTGTGCQLSALLTACLAANPDHPLEAAAAAVGAMGLAGERGWDRMRELDGNIAYRGYIIDTLYRMTGDQLEGGIRFEIR